METKKLLKGVGIGCGAFLIWIIGLSSLSIRMIVVLLLIMLFAHEQPSSTHKTGVPVDTIIDPSCDFVRYDTIIPQKGDDLKMVAIGNAYIQQIKHAPHDYGYVEYFLQDINHDDIPELWIYSGADGIIYFLSVYIYDGKLRKIYDKEIGCSGFYKGEDYIVRYDMWCDYKEKSGPIWTKYSYDEATKMLRGTTISGDKYKSKAFDVRLIWVGFKSLKSALGLKYDEEEQERGLHVP